MMRSAKAGVTEGSPVLGMRVIQGHLLKAAGRKLTLEPRVMLMQKELTTKEWVALSSCCSSLQQAC